VAKTRRKITAEQKAAIVRRHLKDKEPISSIAEEPRLKKFEERLIRKGVSVHDPSRLFPSAGGFYR
jgi:hypothetical protein